MKENFGNEIKIDMDLLISGAILIDVGKLIEYGKTKQILPIFRPNEIKRYVKYQEEEEKRIEEQQQRFEF
mgnify:CR=1 FL=1